MACGVAEMVVWAFRCSAAPLTEALLEDNDNRRKYLNSSRKRRRNVLAMFLFDHSNHNSADVAAYCSMAGNESNVS